MELVDELISVLEVPEARNKLGRIGNRRESWKSPEDNWIEINTDGAIDLMQSVAGAGLVARVHQGNFRIACLRKCTNIKDPFTIELLACRDADVFAKMQGYQKVQIETDCQFVHILYFYGNLSGGKDVKACI